MREWGHITRDVAASEEHVDAFKAYVVDHRGLDELERVRAESDFEEFYWWLVGFAEELSVPYPADACRAHDIENCMRVSFDTVFEIY